MTTASASTVEIIRDGWSDSLQNQLQSARRSSRSTDEIATGLNHPGNPRLAASLEVQCEFHWLGRRREEQ